MAEVMRVSVIVPLQDEETSVRELLASLGRQSVLPDELVVVDAGSTDRTADIVRAFEAPFPVVLLLRSRLFPGEARNEGVVEASGNWIAFADGGTRLHVDWLEALLTAAGATGADVVYGSYEPVCDTFFCECAAMAYLPAYAAWGGRGPFVASSLMRRQVLTATGGFPPFRAAEDLVLFERIAASGYQIAHAPSAIVDWQIARTWTATFRRFESYSYHNLLAGRARQWHWGIARHYVLICLLVGAAMALGFGVLGLLVAPIWLLARATRAAWRKRKSFAFDTLDPKRVLLSAAILVSIDMATCAGAARWVLRRSIKREA